MARVRSAASERSRYNGLTPPAFAEAIGVSVEVAYGLIEARCFVWTKDARGRRVPECQDTRRTGAKNPQYRIHQNAVDRWFRGRAVTAKEEPHGEESRTYRPFASPARVDLSDRG